jgi:hypothetical protein
MLTVCSWCQKRTRPDISVSIEDRRRDPRLIQLNYAFLSPIVLRKEMDTLINIGNEQIMRNTSFIDKHPTQFWNLVYVFQRIHLRHNLDQLIIQSKLLQTEQKSNSDTDSGSHSMDSSNSIVEIKLSWDSELVNSSMSHPPMYRVYKEYRKPNMERNLEILKYRHDFLQTIVESIKNNDCNSPLLKMLWEFRRRPEIGVKSIQADSEAETVLVGVRRSCYREALFLLISAVGQDNIEIPLFDQHWNEAHNLLERSARELRVLNDRTPTMRTFNIREYLRPLKTLPLLH